MLRLILLIAVFALAPSDPARGSESSGSSTAPAAKPGAKSAQADKDGWPGTRAGDIARRWTIAFSTGEEAMRAFQQQELAKASLAKRSNDERTANYRKLKERFGKLTLAAVEKSTPSELVVQLMDTDGKQHKFTFQLEEKEPFRLVSVSMTERVPGGHGGFGGFHH